MDGDLRRSLFISPSPSNILTYPRIESRYPSHLALFCFVFYLENYHFCGRRALDETIDAVNRTTVEGKGERKKGEKLTKDAEKKRKELEGVRDKVQKAEEDFGELEEKAYEVSWLFIFYLFLSYHHVGFW